MAKKKEPSLETEQLPTTKAKKAAAPKAPKAPKEALPVQEIRGAVEKFQTEFVDFEKETFAHCKIKYLAKPKKTFMGESSQTSHQKDL